MVKYNLRQFEEFENQPFIPISEGITKNIKEVFHTLFPNLLFPIKKIIKMEPSKIHFPSNPKLEEKKENDIQKTKVLLNKLTEKTYNDILKQIENILIHTEEDKTKIGNLIFDIACSNRFYSQLYSQLCKYLIMNYDFMNEIFRQSYENFIKMFENIEYVDSNENYDKFCENNKLNEKRKAMSMFIVNLTKENLLSKEDVKVLFVDLVKKIIEWKKNPEKKNEISEITENIFILFILIQELNEIYIEEKHLLDWFTEFSKYDIKEYQGFNSKTKFKFLDILETFSF